MSIVILGSALIGEKPPLDVVVTAGRGRLLPVLVFGRDSFFKLPEATSTVEALTAAQKAVRSPDGVCYVVDEDGNTVFFVER